MVDGVRTCECCGKSKCKKFYKLPLGNPTKKIVTVCGRCVVHNAKMLRKWLDEQEENL